MKVEISNIEIDVSVKKYVAVKPDGSIMGPIGDDKKFVKESLIIGYLRTYPTFVGTREDVWKKICDLGYTIRLASIKLIDEV
jgi:hypothetical protein